MGQICLGFLGVSQKWLSFITVNWISLTDLGGMTEFGPLLYYCAIKTVNLLAARNNIKKNVYICWDVLWIAV